MVRDDPLDRERDDPLDRERTIARAIAACLNRNSIE